MNTADAYEVVTLLPWNPVEWLSIMGTILGVVVLIGVLLIYPLGYLYRVHYEVDSYDSFGWPTNTGITVLIVTVLLGGLVTGMGADNNGSTWDIEQRDSALLELGYENVKSTSEKYDDGNLTFTASQDGEYVEAMLVRKEDNDFYVIQKVGPEAGSESERE